MTATKSRTPGFAGVILLALTCGSVWGQRADFTPPEVRGIEIEDRSGEFIPADLSFVDEQGQAVVLGDYLNQGRPLVVQLLYFDCPMLCNLVLNGFVDGAQTLKWRPGDEYTVLSVSFDPRDTPKIARQKKENYVESLGDSTAGKGWHFLTGNGDNARTLAEALGFPYRFDQESGEFSHGAGMFVLTPEGKISRTLTGLEYTAATLRFSLMEASKGKLGSPLDKIVLFCFRYNAEDHRYTFVAVNAMKIGGAICALGLMIFLAVMWRRERQGPAQAA